MGILLGTTNPEARDTDTRLTEDKALLGSNLSAVIRIGNELQKLASKTIIIWKNQKK
jgi:hypothetical protein